MNEWLMIASMVIGGLGFSIGGTGFKWVRRYVMPLLLGAICYYAHIPLWQCICFAISLSVALHLPYGEKTPFWAKCLTFSSYALATVWLGFSWLQILGPVSIIVTYWLSNNKYTSSVFPWKICEFSFGVTIGSILANIISKVKL